MLSWLLGCSCSCSCCCCSGSMMVWLDEKEVLVEGSLSESLMVVMVSSGQVAVVIQTVNRENSMRESIYYLYLNILFIIIYLLTVPVLGVVEFSPE